MSGDLEDLKLDVDGEYAKKYEEGEEIGQGSGESERPGELEKHPNQDVKLTFLGPLFPVLSGSGASSVVRLCTERATGKEFAVKVYPGQKPMVVLVLQAEKYPGVECEMLQYLPALQIMSRKQTMMDEGKFASEIGIMRALNHPHIMGVQDVYKTKMKIKVVMELATGGELFERICDQNNFEEKQAQKLAGDLFKALAYMHSKGVAHRDLKPENILFLDESEDSPVKIADFGFAKMSGGKGGRRRMNTALGTQGYSGRTDVYECVLTK
eukprot:1380527-Amorphochlora_amoeboformis.AAC.1